MKRLNSTAALIALTSAVTATTALADPQVDGYTINFPDDGWYQVQDAYDYAEICGGGSSCESGPGLFIVTNHTTGKRYENFVVRDLSGAPTTISVSGSTISWPDDGWYQVQRADDYLTVCEAGRQCDVEDGVYVVINHTTGERFRGILVEADYVPVELPVEPSEELPEDLPEEPIDEQPDEQPNMSARLDEAAPYILESLAGFQIEQIYNYMTVLSEEIAASASLIGELAPNNNIFGTEYSCSDSATGRLIQESESTQTTTDGLIQDRLITRLRFQDCLFEARSDNLLSGDHLINGTVILDIEAVGLNAPLNINRVIEFRDFSLSAPEGNSLDISAVAIVNADGDSVNPNSRSVVMDYYIENRNDVAVREINNSTFIYDSRSDEDGAVQTFEGSIGGFIATSANPGVFVTVNTLELLTRTSVLNEEFADRRVPFTGEISMGASDGSSLSILAKPGAPEFDAPLLYDYTLLTGNGESITGDGQLPTFSTAPLADSFY